MATTIVNGVPDSSEGHYPPTREDIEKWTFTDDTGGTTVPMSGVFTSEAAGRVKASYFPVGSTETFSNMVWRGSNELTAAQIADPTTIPTGVDTGQDLTPFFIGSFGGTQGAGEQRAFMFPDGIPYKYMWLEGEVVTAATVSVAFTRLSLG